MKKGEITVEALVKMLPNILAIILLFGIFALLLYALFAEEKTPADRDFERILAEYEDIQRPEIGKGRISINVPLQAQEVYYVVFYQERDPNLPTSCRDDSCVCLYKKKGVIYGETCQRYPKITACEERCGPLCLEKTSTLVPAGRNQITITRDCNVLTIT